MNPSEIIQKWSALSADRRAEMTHRIDSILADLGGEMTHEAGTRVSDWKDEAFQTLACLSANRDSEEDPVIYSLDDLQERWV
ncbi:MAG: hypothetical protein H7834_03475 [Magnetococcus sp. YQC-9]